MTQVFTLLSTYLHRRRYKVKQLGWANKGKNNMNTHLYIEVKINVIFSLNNLKWMITLNLILSSKQASDDKACGQ